MDLVYIGHDYRYWSQILFCNIPTPAYDLEGKVTDLEVGMIIDYGPKFYSALSPPYDIKVKVTDLETLS